MTIIFYDISSTLPDIAWSPNTWKTRFVLNYKGIPYRTEWVEYPDIEEHNKKLGIPPTSTKADGTPFYTLPAIHDTTTSVYLADSFLIAEYLEKAYPQTPTVFPGNTSGLQATFEDVFRSQTVDNLWSSILPAVLPKHTPPSKAYFCRERERSPGKALEEIPPWDKVKEGLDKVDRWYAKSGGPFLMGSTVSWADFVVAAWLIWLRIVWGEDNAQWKDIASWQKGRWKALLDELEEYQNVL